jgi:hypothetical protein
LSFACHEAQESDREQTLFADYATPSATRSPQPQNGGRSRSAHSAIYPNTPGLSHDRLSLPSAMLASPVFEEIPQQQFHLDSIIACLARALRRCFFAAGFARLDKGQGDCMNVVGIVFSPLH